MRLYEGLTEVLKVQKFRRIVSYTVFYCFTAVVTYAYTDNTTRAGFSRADQFYASYPAGTELLTDTTKLYKAALGNCFESEDWGPIEFRIMAKHFERQGQSPYAYHAGFDRILKNKNYPGLLTHLHICFGSNTCHIFYLTGSLMEAARLRSIGWVNASSPWPNVEKPVAYLNMMPLIVKFLDGNVLFLLRDVIDIDLYS